MNTGSLLLRLMMVTGILILVGSGSVAQDSPVTRTELLRKAITEMSGQEGVLFKAVMIPGGASAKHTHPGDEFIYILNGTLIVEPEGEAPVTLRAGDTLYHPKDKVHSARNGSTSEPAEVLVFMVTEVGKPLASAVE